MGLFDQVKSFFVRKKKYRPETLTELKQLVNNPAVSLKDIDISQVTSFEGLFEYCKRTDYSGIENWDVSHVTNMKRCFYACLGSSVKDISGWDVSNVKDASQMFAHTLFFNQDLSSWDFKSLKEPFTGAMVAEMFKGADAMRKRIQTTYLEHLEKGEQPEQIFKKLPIPVPKDYDKLMIFPQTNRDTRKIFERINDFSKLDTSAVTKLDNVLKDSKRTDFTGIEKLDLNNVKTAKNFLSGSKIDKEFSVDQSTYKPKMENLVYADGMLKDTTYNEDLPSMPKVKVIDGLMENNPVFNKPIDPVIKDSELVSVNNAFNAISKPVIEDQEILKTEQARDNLNLIETNRITNNLKKIDTFNKYAEGPSHDRTFNKKAEDISNEIHEFLKNDKDYVVVIMDPKTRDEILSKTRDNTIRNAFVANDNLNENNQKYQNNLNANTYVVKRGIYDKITKLGNVNNPYLDYETPVKDAICKFELVNFAQKFNLKQGNISLNYKNVDIENGINEDVLNCENALPTLKFMEEDHVLDKHSIHNIYEVPEEEKNVIKNALATQKNYLLHRLDKLTSTGDGRIALDGIKQIIEYRVINFVDGTFKSNSSKDLKNTEEILKEYTSITTNPEQISAASSIIKTLRELASVDKQFDHIEKFQFGRFAFRAGDQTGISSDNSSKYITALLNGEKLGIKPLSDTEQSLVKDIVHKEKSYSR